jgi:GNAT superfamily N-acetyltransferase
MVRGDGRAHRADVIAIATRNLEMTQPEAQSRYERYYAANPLGPPYLWLAQDTESDAFVGMAAAFPTRLRISGEPVPGAVAGDFAVDSEHRGVGAGAAMSRALMSSVVEDGLDYIYLCPNEASNPVLARIGYAEVGTMTRFVKVLEAGATVARRVRPKALARLASRLSPIVADPLLSALSRERFHRRSDALSVERPALFDERFSDVWESGRSQHGIAPDRDADILNWKYGLMSPPKNGSPHSIFALLSSADRVVGYIVYRVDDGVRDVLDILSLPSRPVMDDLLSAFVLEARREECRAIHVEHLGPAGLLTRRLRAFGFARRRGGTRLRIYVRPGIQWDRDALDEDNWYFLRGDKDI